MARRSAEPGRNGKNHTTRRSDRFLAGLANAGSVIFVSHVHPDPDSLGSMLGLAHLITSCLDKPTRLTRDGAICRAENRVAGRESETPARADRGHDLERRRCPRHGR